ncbi:polysaccharide biosynthesis C-terminal domain-containing protein, partial [candidate division KSB1 bacterium]|nr:polysaccharide biosynthesis C-terminal domain-containing protein [candidate division KSB1 bacterium]
CGLFYLFSDRCAQLIYHDSNEFSLYLKIISFTCFFQITSLIPFQIYRAKLQSVKFIVVSIIGFVIQIILNIYLVVGLKLGVKGVLIGNAVSTLAIFLVNIALTKEVLFLNISLVQLKDLVKFGMPLILVAIANWILQISDRILLEKLASTEELGLYSLGFRFASILLVVVIGPFSTAWGAYCFQIAKKENAKEVFSKVATYWLLILSFFGIGLLVFSPLVIKIMAAQPFWRAQKVLLPLIFMGVVSGMYTILDLGVNIAKKTKYMAYIVGVGAFVNVALNYLLIPGYGMLGAAFASFFTFVLIMAITYHVSQRLYFIPFEKMKLFKISFVFIVISSFSYFIEFANSFFDISFRLFLIIAFIASIYLVKVFDKRELAFIKSVLINFKQTHGLINKIQYGFNLVK